MSNPKIPSVPVNPPPPPSRWELYPVTCKKTNVKQGAHIHQQPTSWLIPHACTQIYHPGSGSRGPFRPYCGSSGFFFFFAASPLSRVPDKTAMLRRLCNNRSLWRILSSNRTIARWRHVTTTTRILEFVVFLCKLRLLFFNPQRDWQI